MRLLAVDREEELEATPVWFSSKVTSADGSVTVKSVVVEVVP